MTPVKRFPHLVREVAAELLPRDMALYEFEDRPFRIEPSDDLSVRIVDHANDGLDFAIFHVNGRHLRYSEAHLMGVVRAEMTAAIDKLTAQRQSKGSAE